MSTVLTAIRFTPGSLAPRTATERPERSSGTSRNSSSPREERSSLAFAPPSSPKTSGWYLVLTTALARSDRGSARVSEGPTMVKGADVRVGDRLRTPTGLELTVTRVDDGFLGRPELLAFVEDSDAQWLKLPLPRDGEVELVGRTGGGSAT